MKTKYSLVGDKLYACEITPDGAIHNSRLVAIVPKSLMVCENDFYGMVERANNYGVDRHALPKYGTENEDTHSPSIINIVFS